MAKSIYKSDEGRKVMARWYDSFVDHLGRDRLSLVEVDTRYGRTNVVIGGPEGAPPLWCFHGAMATAPAALYQLPSLLEHFRVHFPDTVGQPGRSDETRLHWQGLDHGHWVVDVLDAFGAERVQAVGVSLGGYVVLRAAQLAPERIERAVLWVPAGLVKPSVARMWGLISDGLLYALRPNRPRLEKILARTCTDLDDRFVSFMADSLAHVHPDRRFPAIVPASALERWAGRVMLIVHEDDTLFPAEAVVERGQAVFQHLDKIHRVDGWRHMPSFRPEALGPVVDEIRSFMAPGAPGLDAGGAPTTP